MNTVVIGAGPNGLAAAIRLAEAGHQVTVLEAADRAGGAVRTDELTLPGFRHDTFSSVYPAGAASPVFARMPLERHGLRWIHPGACYAHPLPAGRAVALHRELDATEASLEAANAGDGRAWRAFVEPLLGGFDAIRSTMLAGFPPIGGSLRLLSELGPLGAARFGLLVPGSAQGLGRRLFAGPGSRAWLYGSAGHGDVPPTDAGSAVAVTYLNLMGHAVGWPSPAGGAERLTDALTGYLRELGGELRPDTPVEAIESVHGRVTGVRTRGDQRLPADVVVATVMPHALVALAGDALARPYRALLCRYRYGPATIKVDWALDGPIPWDAPEPRVAGTVHVGGRRAGARADDRREPRPAARAPVPAARSAVAGRSITRPRRQAHRLGIHPRPAHRDRLGRADRRSRGADRGAGRALRTGVPGADSGPPRDGVRPSSSGATAIWSVAMSAAEATACARSCSVRCPACRPTERRCRGCTSAAPPRSPAAPCTACPAMPPRRPPWPICRLGVGWRG